MGDIKFSVIIVSWNVRSELQKCLAALEEQRQSSPCFEVVVVDNASSDGSPEMVARAYPSCKLIGLKKNIGFAAACNLGARETSADYVVFLNPDAVVVPGFFSDLERVFFHRRDVGIIGGRLVNEDGSTQSSVRELPGIWVGFLEALKLLGRFPWLAPRYLKNKFNYSLSQPVAQVMGACFAVRTSLWRQLKGFDENFFLWFEEVDFCKRASVAGYTVWYEAGLIVLHSGARSFNQLTYTERHRYFMRSLTYYLYKHSGWLGAALVWLVSRPVFVVTYLYDYAVAKHIR